MKRIQYTIRGVSERMDEVLRKHAVREGKSLNSALVDALRKGLGMTAEPPARYRDLDDLAGTWVEDPEFDRAIAAMDKVDEAMWK
ncbi:MAG: hypothetical protein JXR37_24350 [Kiritimatiellae bacterium]|nr:hypothetical protein [Kiritimatiellia bacterium]